MNFLDLFKNIIDYYRTGNSNYLRSIGVTSKDALMSIANNAFEDTKLFLEKSIIIPVFFNDHTSKLFETYCQVFAAIRTINIIRKQITNPFSIPDQAVNDFLKSYGFDVFYAFDSGTRRFILADLFNLYKKTGTVDGVVTMMKLMGFPFVSVAEHWVEHDTANPNRIVLTSRIVSGDRNNSLSGLKIYVNDTIIQKDPLWRLTEQDILNMEANETWKLPAKSPYFSVLADYDVFGVDTQMSALLASLIAEEMTEYEQTGAITKKAVASSFYGHNLSFTELILAMTFCMEQPYNNGWGWDPTQVPDKINLTVYPNTFDSQTQSLNPRDTTVNAAIDAYLLGLSPYISVDLSSVAANLTTNTHDTGLLFDTLNVDYTPVRHLSYNKPTTESSMISDIKTTYYRITNNIMSCNYREREQRLKEFIDTFTQEGNYIIVDNITNKVGQKLLEINPDFYTFVAQKITNGMAQDVIDNILKDIQAYFITATGMYFQLNPTINYNDVKAAIEFIKPYRARPLVLSVDNVIKDPLDTIYFHEKMRIFSTVRLKCGLSYDDGVTYDGLQFDVFSNPQSFVFDDGHLFDTYRFLFDKSLYTNAVYSFDKHLYFDTTKYYDTEIHNTNRCNRVELQDEIKNYGYVIIKKLHYTETRRSNNAPTLNTIAPYMVETYSIKLNDINDNISLIETKLNSLYNSEQTDEVIEEINKLEQELEFLKELKKAITELKTFYENETNRLINNQVIERVAYDSAFSYDYGDEISFKDGLIIKRYREAYYDNGCYYDIDDSNCYDESTVIVSIDKINPV